MAQVTYNEQEFRSEMGRIAALSGKALSQVIDEQASLFTRDATGFTPPFGNAPSTESPTKKLRIGRKAVQRDVDRAFSSVRELRIFKTQREGGGGSRTGIFEAAFIKSLQRAVRTKNTLLVEELLGRASTRFKGRRVVESPTLELHNQMRNRRGGVTKARSIFVLGPQSEINRYTRRMQDHLGLGKGGWNKPLRAMKVTPPDWVNKQSRSDGIFERVEGDTPSITVGNKVPFVQDSASRIEQRAWNNRMRNVTKQREALERWQRKKLREAGIEAS